MSALLTFMLLGIGAIAVILKLVLERYEGLKYFFGSLLIVAAILALGKLALTPSPKADSEINTRFYVTAPCRSLSEAN